MTHSSIEQRLARLEELQARVDELETRLAHRAATEFGDGHGGVASGSQKAPMSRRAMLTAAAAGAVGVVGSGALLSETSVVKAASPRASQGPTSFSSSSGKPAVTAANAKTGTAVSASSGKADTIVANQKSTAANASGVRGIVKSASPGANSAGVRGVNNGTGANGAGVSGSHAGGGDGVYGVAPAGVGVSGSSISGTGAAGASQTGPGVSGSSASGTGITGTSQTGTGVSGSSGSTNGGAVAILGTITSAAPGGSSAGVLGVNNGTGGLGIGVYGSQNGYGWGVYGTTPSGLGVYGYSAAGVGVQGGSYSGTGIYASSSGGIGVDSHSSSSIGVHGTSGSGTAVQGDSTSGYGVYGGSTTTYGVVGVTTSGNGVYGQVAANSQAGVVGRQENSSGNWAIYGFGNIGATGTKSAIVPAADGNGHLTLYCMESPECWFEDFGSAKLEKGAAHISIEPVFGQTIDTGEYYVFLEAEGECNSLFVKTKSPDGFTVRESGAGASDVPFSYRIVGRRKDVEAPRLRRATMPETHKVGSPVEVRAVIPMSGIQRPT